MKIGLISDVHATVAPLQEALALFRQHHVDMTICAGDTAGYAEELEQTVNLLIESQSKIIRGNHDDWFLNEPAPEEHKWIKNYFSSLPENLSLSVSGKNIYVVHASPPNSKKEGINLLDEYGHVIPEQKIKWTNSLNAFEYDVLIVGHTHQVFSEKLGETLIINPGSTKFNHACAILTLPEMTVEVLPLSNKEPVKTWNWSRWNNT